MSRNLRRLTWDYFIDQKFNEVVNFLFFGSLIIFLPYYLGNLIMRERPIPSDFAYFAIGRWIAGAFSLFVLFAIIALIAVWIDSNWTKAKRRARKQIRSGK